MATIRAFIALDLSEEARAVLAQVSDTLSQKTAEGAVKWVDASRMHLTLRFLGNTPTEKLDSLAASLDGVARQHRPFTLTLDALGCFPNERKPRGIWVGLGGDLEPLQALYGTLQGALEPLGWEAEDRDFHPHLTLGRVKDRRAKIDLPWGQGVAPAKTVVSEVVLYESQLRPQGPLHTVRHASALGGRGQESGSS